MATPADRLSESLDALRDLQSQDTVAIRSTHLTRTHRERLLAAGFLKEVMKGWYVAAHPGATPGDSTAWYASFWGFTAAYLTERFGTKWCLSPEQSLLLHAGNRTVPQQLVVRTPSGGNKATNLPHGTAVLDVRAALPKPGNITTQGGLRLFSVPTALVAISDHLFQSAPADLRAALMQVKDASDVLEPLLAGGHSVIAGRLAGAFRSVGQDGIADEIVKTMTKAGYTVRETNPFSDHPRVTGLSHGVSPYVNRLRAMWQDMRGPILDVFPKAPGIPKHTKSYLKAIDDAYVSDAYHSLSIEGYRLSAELIERVKSGGWNPEANAADMENTNALAARGYFDAFTVVKTSVGKVLKDQSAGETAREDHREWYRQLFGPAVTARIIKPEDLAGYRSGQVYIRGSMHVPPPKEAVRDCMPAFFDLLKEETEPAVRVVLGHFAFVYIHPYMDGNGRIGRFLMNLMLASGGYPWTVIPVDTRKEYMSALEAGSARQDIRPFAAFLADLVKNRLRGNALPVAE